MHFADNEIQFANEFPECSGWRDNVVARGFERLSRAFLFHCNGFAEAVGAELSDEGAVYSVAAAGIGGLDLYDGIPAFGPERVSLAIRQKEGLGIETSDFKQGHFQGIVEVINPVHLDVLPVTGKNRLIIFNVADDFRSMDAVIANIRTEPRNAGGRSVQRQNKLDGVPAVQQYMGAGQRRLAQATDWLIIHARMLSRLIPPGNVCLRGHVTRVSRTAQERTSNMKRN